MSVTPLVKDECINLRLKHSAKQMLECAEQAIYEHEVMSLSAQDSETFFNALVASVKFNQKLSEALKKHDQCVISK